MEIWGSKLLVIVTIVTIHVRSGSGDDYDGDDDATLGSTTVSPGLIPICDLSDLNCLDHRSAEKPLFWKNQKTILSLPNFHGLKASKPDTVLPDGSVIIKNEVKTAWGNWLEWKECPEGMYVVGHDIFVSGDSEDYLGIFYINFLCWKPGSNETNTTIDACAPNACPEDRPTTAGYEYDECPGAFVGFSLLVAPPRRSGKDHVAADGLDIFCSTNITKQGEDETKQLGKAVSSKYGWTDPVFCDKYQAMCGFQVQMQDYIPTKDNTAMNNLKIKCCKVPDPLEDCEPTEERVFIRTCDNSDSAEGLRCDFDSRIGLSVDYENEAALLFHFSIGYDFFSIKDKMKEKIISYLRNNKEYTMEYLWHAVSCNVERPETSSIKTICVKPYESVELYQIAGQCGYFWVRTNRFLMVVTRNGREFDEYMHLN